MGVVKLNGTYLELADKYYGFRGWLSFGMLLIAGVCLFFLGSFTHTLITTYIFNPARQEQVVEGVMVWLFIVSLLSALVAVGVWGLRKESFWLTHLPIRLNRKTGMIHLFRPKRGRGILSVPWDEVFFTIGRGQTMGNRDMRGHVLAVDKLTVLESFSINMPGEKVDDLHKM
jgi:hypothetical protein